MERINFIDLTHKKEQHGLTYHPLYNVWREMRRRCDNPNHKWYPFYGGRGISVCKRWNTRFSNFYDDVIGLYKPNHVIDRVDNDGNYELSNIRFVPISTSNANKRNNSGKQRSGCTRFKNKYWRSRIKIEGIEYHLGYFKTKQEGEDAFNLIHKEWYGF